MEENTSPITDEVIFERLGTIFSRYNKNNQLQELAANNGLDVKNSVKLSNDSFDNVAVTIVALLLAKRENDPRYKNLVHVGMEKRALKVEIINDYKNQANQFINRYKQELISNSSI